MILDDSMVCWERGMMVLGGYGRLGGISALWVSAVCCQCLGFIYFFLYCMTYFSNLMLCVLGVLSSRCCYPEAL